MPKIYTEAEKLAAATEVMNARQNLKELGPNARKSDIARLKKAKQTYTRVVGRRP